MAPFQPDPRLPDDLAMRGNSPLPPYLKLPERWPTDPVNRYGLKAFGTALEVGAAATRLGRSVMGQYGLVEDTTQAVRVEPIIEKLGWPSRPLRLGVIEPGAWAQALHDSGENANVEWFCVPAGEASDACERHTLDAIIAVSPDDQVTVNTLLHPDMEAGWYDWGMPRPLSYASVFPHQLDCEQLTCSLSAGDSPEFVRALIDCAAWSSRWPSRLTLADRVRGRQPCIGHQARIDRVHAWRPSVESFSGAAMILMQHVCANARMANPSQSMRAAARMVSAHLTTSTTPMTDTVRRAGIESCAAIAGDEPEVALRLLAARIACMDDRAGMEALRLALSMVRGRDLLGGIDPYLFLQAELAGDQSVPLAVGRLAAGIGIVAANSTAEKMAFVREDFADDMLHSGLLVGREQDQALLIEVFRVLERELRPQKVAA